ncbi:hypothetical protein F9451_24565 [Escherichia coli]|nr:hypothetical protein [Escherichia coli]EEW2551617.1 hypothetical protein [Escherichia coli]EEW3255217.1 hypothetical protein [Escherichia coli]EFA4768276.1 hypothetical protein [Escherichia coli]EFB1479815.1 hypothetical protein [Escherichia coli]
MTMPLINIVYLFLQRIHKTESADRDSFDWHLRWVYRWICPYISRHLLSLNPLQARLHRYSRGER